MSANPYASSLGKRDALEVMEATPVRWAAVLANLTRDQLETPTAPGKWSIREIVAHLADCELAFGFRMRQIHAGATQIQSFHQDDWAKAYASYTLRDAFGTFRSVRAWNVAFLKGISKADREKYAVHPEYGEFELWTVAEMIAGHDLHHLEKLEK